MPSIDTYRKQAKLIVRWHRDGNYSVGEKLRMLERYRHRTDREVLDAPLPLTLAQEIVAVEAGFANWVALKAAATDGTFNTPNTDGGVPSLTSATPILFVRDVAAAATFYEGTLGFDVDFLHGKPPFYGAISRGEACLHLRHVDCPNFAELWAREPSLILVTIEVRDIKSLFEEFQARGVDFCQRLLKQAWGGTDFHVRDPDGNVLSFVQYRQTRVPES